MPETDPPMLSPTVGRRWLAQEIRRLREAAGLKQTDVAKRLRCNPTKITHLESMRTPVGGPDLEVLLPFLGVPVERVEWYLRVCDLAREKGWWDGDRSIPDWFSLYVGLEAGASEIRCWDTGYVTGLFQTAAYATALLDNPGAVEARLRRQEALRRDDPLVVHAILDEAVLCRRIGDAGVMRGQLDHLGALAEMPDVTIQVMPFDAAGHRGHLGSFKWLGFPQEDDPGAVYLENQFGGWFLEKPEELAIFQADFADLVERALPEEDSAALIARRAEELR
ncbi:helix-turn-helix domain-containing protein [Saccharothrix longispora]|uniref:Transcriptional regulator with XRE-family HTH domain n=1 Tax=Saccharothrix longispora TaxID=33920 RepID=A0ABU1Q382_9PSEU|nr:helix-turn-helix transcriptional regulator [Saccharothrix longispora]MDR6597362.1 transcriptional regulator with XRE-family HTH domain [Saccharothrix longispora]